MRLRNSGRSCCSLECCTICSPLLGVSTVQSYVLSSCDAPSMLRWSIGATRRQRHRVPLQGEGGEQTFTAPWVFRVLLSGLYTWRH